MKEKYEPPISEIVTIDEKDIIFASMHSRRCVLISKIIIIQ